MGSQEALMAVLTEYALGLEIDIAELEKSIDDLNDNFTFGRSGCIIWYGTVQAVKDSK